MLGKIILLVILGLTLAKIQPDYIKLGLYDVNDMKEETEISINDAVQSLNETKHIMEKGVLNSWLEENLIMNKALSDLKNLNEKFVAVANAKKSKPDVFKCIETENKNTKNTIVRLSSNYRNYFSFTAVSSYLPVIESQFESFSKILGQMEMKHLNAVAQIKKCQNEACVKDILQTFSNWINDTILSTIDKALADNELKFKEFENRLTYAFETQEDGVRNEISACEFLMGQCIYQ